MMNLMTSLITSDPVTEYANNVIYGEIPACETIKKACKRHLADIIDGIYLWDGEAAERVFKFFSFLRHYKGEWAGKPFELEHFQKFIIGSIFGWKNPDGTRRYRTAMIFLPKKNGKSPLAAGIGLYHLTADGEPAAEVYTVARTRDQASIVYRDARAMVQKSPKLREKISILRPDAKVGGYMQYKDSIFEALASNFNNLDGPQPSVVIMDEVHQWGSNGAELFNIFNNATCSRRNPLILMITTTGTDQNSLCKSKFDYGISILNRTIQDDSTFVYIATADDGDEWNDPLTWQKCNPNLGVSVKLKALEIEAHQAESSPSEQVSFEIKHLNRWKSSSSIWIPLEIWDQTSDITPLEELKGRKCYGGLDLSKVKDLTSWCLVFPREDDPRHIDVLWRFWLPQSALDDKQNKYRDQYQRWKADGHLTVIPGQTIDYEIVRAAILEDMQQYQIESANMDRLYNGYEMGEKLQADGLPVVTMGMGFLSFAVPCVEFERKILEGQIHHGGNPIARWMIEGCTVVTDAAGNMKPMKANKQAKIDGVVTLILAIDRLIRPTDPTEECRISFL
jgi:phage terminase large subunit-like protein